MFKAIDNSSVYGYSGPCFCVGPQNGEESCPCVMRGKEQEQQLPARGQPMPDTMEGLRHLTDQYAKTIVEQKDEISRLKVKLNKAEQRRHDHSCDGPDRTNPT